MPNELGYIHSVINPSENWVQVIFKEDVELKDGDELRLTYLANGTCVAHVIRKEDAQP